jgi:F-type H+-transporting ATPase subunit c
METVAAYKLIGAGLAAMGAGFAAIGVGLIFGFAVTEALGLIAAVVALALAFG